MDVLMRDVLTHVVGGMTVTCERAQVNTRLATQAYNCVSVYVRWVEGNLSLCAVYVTVRVGGRVCDLADHRAAGRRVTVASAENKACRAA